MIVSSVFPEASRREKRNRRTGLSSNHYFGRLSWTKHQVGTALENK